MEDERDQEVRGRFADLDRARSELIQHCQHYLTRTEVHTHQHLYVIAAARRLLTQSRAFKNTVLDKNGQVASALLRLQLDTVLRLYAIFWVKDPETFAKAVRGGKQINRISDRLKNQMTDKYLATKLTGTYPWIATVYENTSGLIHFSARHMVDVVEIDDATGQPLFKLFDDDGDVPLGYYREVVTAFLHVTMIAGTAIRDCLHRLDMHGTIADQS